MALALGAVAALVAWRSEQPGLRRLLPVLLAGMTLAFLVNLLAFPTTLGLLPYVAREIYRIDQTGLGTLIAAFSAGALTGSISIGFLSRRLRAARIMVVMAVVWYSAVMAFAWMPDAHWGRAMLFVAGLSQRLSMVPVGAMLMRVSEERYRGRVMGVRMLAIYGLPIGLMAYGHVMEAAGFVGCMTIPTRGAAPSTIAWYASSWAANNSQLGSDTTAAALRQAIDDP